MAQPTKTFRFDVQKNGQNMFAIMSYDPSKAGWEGMSSGGVLALAAGDRVRVSATYAASQGYSAPTETYQLFSGALLAAS